MSSRALKSVFVWLAVLGGSALLLAVVTIDVQEAQRVRGAEANSVTTIDYFSGTTHYAVPMKYYPGIKHYSEKRNYSALTLMLFLPDLSPAAEHLEEMKRPGWHDQMTLLIEHGPHVTDPDAQIAWMTNFPRGVHTLPEAAANGCEIYRTPLMMPGDVFVCPEDGSKLVISCDRKSDVRNCSPGQADAGIFGCRGSPLSVSRMASMARMERLRAVSMTERMSA